MEQSKHDVNFGRFLSLVLRHQTEEAAWRYVRELLYP